MSALNGSWIEIFKAGDYGPRGRWTADDLDRLAAAYNPRLHQAPVVLGHPAADAPAYGWVARLRRAGQSLWAQLEKVDPAFEQLLRAGRFRQRSVALYRNFAPAGGAYLRHLGFLGAQPPAVKGLAPVRFAESATVCFAFDDCPPPGDHLLPPQADRPEPKSRLEAFFDHLRSFFSPEASTLPAHGEESHPAGSQSGPACDSSPPTSSGCGCEAPLPNGEGVGSQQSFQSGRGAELIPGRGHPPASEKGNPQQPPPSGGQESEAFSVGHGGTCPACPELCRGERSRGSRAEKKVARSASPEGSQGNPSGRTLRVNPPRVSLESAPNPNHLAAFSERVAQLEQRVHTLSVEKERSQEKFAAAETAARQADVAQFAESLRAAGRFPPAFDRWGVAEFMQHLAAADILGSADPTSSQQGETVQVTGLSRLSRETPRAEQSRGFRPWDPAAEAAGLNEGGSGDEARLSREHARDRDSSPAVPPEADSAMSGHGSSERSGDPALHAGCPADNRGARSASPEEASGVVGRPFRADKNPGARRASTEGVRGNPARVSPDRADPRHSLLAWFQDFLTKLPAVIEFRELSAEFSHGPRVTDRGRKPTEARTGVGGSHLVSFAQPRRGMEIDPASVELAERAEALAAEAGVTYAEALTQLRQENRHRNATA